jgi:ubiquinone/menaquinone biosynthesis C-methylase UbiE
VVEKEVKQKVQEFYNQVGWQQLGDGLYQNAAYEDLRPVSSEYIHRCHLRVSRHLQPAGRFLLDAGSGPIQYIEYLEYSRQYQRRVCVDISILALQEARKRIGQHGLFVVADVANLPFKAGSFEGAVSLHTIHHLPAEEHPQAYAELARVLVEEGSAVVVNGWSDPPLMWAFKGVLKLAKKARQARALKKQGLKPAARSSPQAAEQQRVRKLLDRRGTFVSKNNAAWLKRQVGQALPQGRRLEIWCWRSVSVEFLRTFIHQRLGGRGLLRLVYWLEERFPHWLGEIGQYPLVVITPKTRS